MWHPKGGLQHSVQSYMCRHVQNWRYQNRTGFLIGLPGVRPSCLVAFLGPMSRRICQVFALQHGCGTGIIATPPMSCSHQKEAPPGNGCCPVSMGLSSLWLMIFPVDSNIRIKHWLFFFFLPPLWYFKLRCRWLVELTWYQLVIERSHGKKIPCKWRRFYGKII